MKRHNVTDGNLDPSSPSDFLTSSNQAWGSLSILSVKRQCNAALGLSLFLPLLLFKEIIIVGSVSDKKTISP